MNYWSQFARFVSTGSNWTGPTGMLHRLVEHLVYTGAAVGLAIVLAVPLGLWLGHIGRGGALATNLSNVGRAVPTFALLVLLYLEYGEHRVVETIAALTFFALAPLLTNTYVSIRSVDRPVVEAARGMGMSGGQILRRIEVPLSLPLLMTGLRIAVVQVVGTATIAAYIGAGGLGRLVVDGFSERDYGMMLAGATLVAVLALVLDGLLAVVQRVSAPGGVAARPTRARLGWFVHRRATDLPVGSPGD